MIFFPSAASSSCPSSLDNHDAWQFFLSFVLWLGILFSYVPQQLKIIHLGSSEGLSLGFLILSYFGSLITFLNVLVLQGFLVPCCWNDKADWPWWYCFEQLLGLLQVFTQWLMITIIYALYLHYLPTTTAAAAAATDAFRPPPSALLSSSPWSSASASPPPSPPTPTPSLSSSASSTPLLLLPPSHRRCRLPPRATDPRTVTVAGTLTCVLATLGVLVLFPVRLRAGYTVVLGYTGAWVAMVQYLPQLRRVWTTWRAGAVSLLTVGVQCPGTLLLLWTLVGRSEIRWVHVASYVVSMLAQGVLVGLLVAVKVGGKWRGSEGGGRGQMRDDDDDDDEEEEEVVVVQPATAAAGPLGRGGQVQGVERWKVVGDADQWWSGGNVDEEVVVVVVDEESENGKQKAEENLVDLVDGSPPFFMEDTPSAFASKLPTTVSTSSSTSLLHGLDTTASLVVPSPSLPGSWNMDDDHEQTREGGT